MLTKRCVVGQVNRPVMMMTTVSVQCMSTPWKAFGRSYVPGYVRIEGSLKKSYRCTWAFVRSFTTLKSKAEPYSVLYWKTYLLNSPESLLSQKSLSSFSIFLFFNTHFVGLTFQQPL